MSKLVEQFLKLKPTRFDGRGDTEATPRWVEELEKAFEVLGCTEEEKVTLAVYQLQDNASHWWRATRSQVFPTGTIPTWTIFTETFISKYFSKSAREQKLAEFMRLCQGQMSVDQYEAEFARLSKFAPRMAIEHDLMDRAVASGSRYASARDDRHFGKRPMAGNKRFVPPARRNIGKSNRVQNAPCWLCGGRHGNGPCPNKDRACFKCGGRGHQIRNCPNNRQAKSSTLPPPPPRNGNQFGAIQPAN
ncbi:uncharacterized protein LOC130135638 [Syzygium oleosum]|uniref:uncharacterized protein LOC130135638 n=1 Tax=Syzygium oleosum TaxID=219896 RepID=UPI0024BBB53F|nr:uncharacterized protein LOC130135638 [Syzygium oleosum]